MSQIILWPIQVNWKNVVDENLIKTHFFYLLNEAGRLNHAAIIYIKSMTNIKKKKKR